MTKREEFQDFLQNPVNLPEDLKPAYDAYAASWEAAARAASGEAKHWTQPDAMSSKMAPAFQSDYMTLSGLIEDDKIGELPSILDRMCADFRRLTEGPKIYHPRNWYRLSAFVEVVAVIGGWVVHTAATIQLTGTWMRHDRPIDIAMGLRLVQKHLAVLDAAKAIARCNRNAIDLMTMVKSTPVEAN